MIGFIVCCIVAVWFLYNASILPLALAICLTVFGSIAVLGRLLYWTNESDS